MASQKCAVCNNITTDPSGRCYLHRGSNASGSVPRSIPTGVPQLSRDDQSGTQDEPRLTIRVENPRDPGDVRGIDVPARPGWSVGTGPYGRPALVHESGMGLEMTPGWATYPGWTPYGPEDSDWKAHWTSNGKWGIYPIDQAQLEGDGPNDSRLSWERVEAVAEAISDEG